MSINKKLYQDLYQSIITPRLIEQKMLNLLRQGKLSKWFSGIGQEAISVGVTKALKANDTIFTMHRNLGVFTSRNIPLENLFGQIIGNELGFTKENDIVKSMVANGSILDMPQFPRGEVNKICKTFNFYVKFPRSKWSTIRKAEENTEEGEKIYNDLKEEFIYKFWNKDISFEESARENDPHSSVY